MSTDQEINTGAGPRNGAAQPSVVVVIPAAGSGSRLGAGGNKVLLPLGGQPMIRHAVRPFQVHARIRSIVLAIRPEDAPRLEAVFPPGPEREKLLPWVPGGAERQQSVLRALEALAGDPPDWVLIHDGARPFCPRQVIDRVLEELTRGPAAVPVIPVSDSLRRMESGGARTVSRENLVRVQTPQGFHWGPLWKASREAAASGYSGTDEAQLVESAGVELAYVQGDPENIKITTPAEHRWAERFAG